MNIFYLDKDPTIAARYMHDKHIVKMIIECAQMLTHVHDKLDLRTRGMMGYPQSVARHPCTLWVLRHPDHYEWLSIHFRALCMEYYRRYLTMHSLHGLVTTFQEVPELLKSRSTSNTSFEPPLCMPDEYKVKGDAVTSYRNYYIGEKLTWTRTKDGKVFNNKWTFPSIKPHWIET